MSNSEKHWKMYMDKNFLGAWSLPGGRDIVLTIAKHNKEEAWDEKSQKKVKKFSIFFAEKYDFIKPMIVNTVNGEMIEKVTGKADPDDWVGRKIQLGAPEVKAFGKYTPALRVRDVKSDKLEADYAVFTESISGCKTRDELTALMNTYGVFKPYSPEIQKQIKDLWAILPKETSQTSDEAETK